ncbi:MAG: HNH endonuclease [Candidatus Eisenbacteria bacterium]
MALATDSPSAADARVRIEAFRWLREQVAALGDVLPLDLLRRGFTLDGARVPLVGPQGIFKPAVLPELPLSITTVLNGPYADSFTPEGLIRYRYRGTDPSHHENVGLRKAMARRTPLIYFHGVATGRYLAVWPVFIVGDDPAALSFTVAVDDEQIAEESARDADGLAASVQETEGRRLYITTSVKVRLHQRGFRERVLRAYREQCALCRLRHRELLDAAHIIGDSEASGDPVVPNGLSLCKIHHAAFDGLFIGIRPDYVVEVHPRILGESDGPMLRHGLQGLHGSKILLPSQRANYPDRDRLEERHRRFRSAA